MTSSVAIEKHDMNIPNKLAFILHNVFTKEECEAFIKKTEEMGYEQALLNVGGGRQTLRTDIRNSSRCIWDSQEQVDIIWKKIQPFVPPVFKGHTVCGLNERLRFLRYDPGDYFKPHYDGAYVRENGEGSLITLMWYLNEGFKGGNTTFFYHGADPKGVPCVPKTGSVLIFQHDILHEGSMLSKGRKYSVRTDIMYSKDTVAS
ncbi:probable prolyl 4-hydroxylase 8 [Gigantopelta aegis]|uniref:probable prolyl 4-hydroxylase 8 n=1 Tax=Gigantopelta aegis TaxID=1735272 RepID=UPI001B8897D8|nr:probable prolyl 4-hydroxylase 8 [Gigantopelta aegis]XP_041367114.1 probable prolyl 4-hydroxylase 8 [Gigantopelta aegis]XP_041367115.1 probable prolyl 4-hydroxylase 8 [Gigantopelta aegis]XP_041367116.1 probable prolyl 4-hydroxylase 8 [Gigantopelta aegis]